MLRSTMKSVLSIALGLTVVIAVGCGEGEIKDPHGLGQSAGALDPTCGTDPSVCEHAWFIGTVADVHWGAAANDNPSNDPLYLAGPQDPTHPQEHGDASFGIPNHDHIITRGGNRILTIFLLQAGPNATSRNVKQRLDPAGTGLYMPYSVKLNGVFQPLTSSSTVDSAVAAGLLVAVDVGLAFNAHINVP
jgi:hypothetical protein